MSIPPDPVPPASEEALIIGFDPVYLVRINKFVPVNDTERLVIGERLFTRLVKSYDSVRWRKLIYEPSSIKLLLTAE